MVTFSFSALHDLLISQAMVFVSFIYSWVEKAPKWTHKKSTDGIGLCGAGRLCKLGKRINSTVTRDEGVVLPQQKTRHEYLHLQFVVLSAILYSFG